jgi:probable phosphoglycerate mutase
MMMLLFPRTAVRAMVTSSSSSSVINHLLHRNEKLTQSYYALRHGQSLANVEKIISSDPQISTVQHGLSDMGKNQATKAGEMFMEDYHNTANDDYEGVAIFSSDFTRARETASIFAKALSSSQSPQIPIYNNDIILETKLRERYFGTLNGGPDTKYQDVWDIDITNPDHTMYDVESANSVLERTTRLICDLDDMLSSSLSTTSTSSTVENDNESDGKKKKKKWKVILVAHGDVLQILQTGFLLHEDASKHRSLDHLETATIRKLY